MNTRTLAIAAVVGLCFGCQRPAHAAGPAAPTAVLAVPSAVVPNTPAPFATPPMLPGTPDIAALVAKVSPAVVNITTVHDIDPFGMFPFGGGKRPRGDQTFKQHALGTGFIVDSAGHVVTNAHVVEGADEVKVRLQDDREFQATVKGRDARLDLAVLELTGAKDLPSVSLGSSEELRVGDYVVAIGNPFGLGHTVTYGIVSGKSRALNAGPYDDFIQTDASINPGNSGGPLFSIRGQVIGIATAINPMAQGIGFAIPVDALKNVLPQLLTTGRVARGRLGVLVQHVDAALASALGLDRARGALVGQVEPGGPADKAGVKAGDVILKVDQAPIVRDQDLPRVVASHAPASRVHVEVWRDKAIRALDVTLDTLKDDDDSEEHTPAAAGPTGRAPTGLGLGLTDAPGRGVVVEMVTAGGPAEGVLRPGDVVVEVNGRAVARAADAARAIAAVPAGKAVLFKITRDDRPMFAAIGKK
jgi:serine protease Do